MTKHLNWGLLSTARINRRLIGPINKASHSRLIAVASRNAKTAQIFADAWDIPRVFANYETMLASPDINVVYIPLPNALHREWAIKAAQAGKHILCEKPLALTPTEVAEMTYTARANGVVLVEAFMYRMHPQLAKLKALIAKGLIGKVKLIRAGFSFNLMAGSQNIRLRKDLGGGSLWDVGCYPVSFIQAIAESNPTEVFAWQQTNTNGVEISLVGQLKFENDTLAQIDCSFQVPFRAGAEVVGENGVIYVPNPWLPGVDGKPSSLIHIAPDDTETTIAIEDKDPYLCEVEVMEQAVLNNAPLPYNLDHSRGNIATINALYKSAETGEIQVLYDE